MVENLTKENFFNRMNDLYPEAMHHFCKWIDQYKEEVGWNKLFNSNSDYQDVNGKNAKAPKFHDIPFEMQNGIIARYELELFNNSHGDGKRVASNVLEHYKGSISKIFKELQESIDQRARKLNQL